MPKNQPRKRKTAAALIAAIDKRYQKPIVICYHSIRCVAEPHFWLRSEIYHYQCNMAPAMGKQMKKILVLCTGNSCRSQMAEGYLKDYCRDFIDNHVK